MSEQHEPTIADVLAAMVGMETRLAGRIDAVDAKIDYAHRVAMAKIDSVKADVATVKAEVSALSAEVSGLSQSVVALKTDAALTSARAVDAQNMVQVHQHDPGAHGGSAAA